MLVALPVLCYNLCMVYFLQSTSPEQLIKIGNSENPRNRVSELQTGNGYRLILLKVVKGGKVEERELHKKFQDLQVCGEWFKPEQKLVDFIDSLLSDKEFR